MWDFATSDPLEQGELLPLYVSTVNQINQVVFNYSHCSNYLIKGNVAFLPVTPNKSMNLLPKHRASIKGFLITAHCCSIK